MTRSYLQTPELNLWLMPPGFHEGRLRRGYSPDSNADEARWARQEPTGNQCPGTKALVQQRVNHFRSGLALRAAKSNGAAGPPCHQRPKHSRKTSGPIPGTRQMQIPPFQ